MTAGAHIDRRRNALRCSRPTLAKPECALRRQSLKDRGRRSRLTFPRRTLRPGQALDVQEMAGLDPGFAAFWPGHGPKRASRRKPKPGIRIEPVFAVLEA